MSASAGVHEDATASDVDTTDHADDDAAAPAAIAADAAADAGATAVSDDADADGDSDDDNDDGVQSHDGVDLETISDSAGVFGGGAGVEVVAGAASAHDAGTARDGDEDYAHFDSSTSKAHDSADHESAGRARWPVRGRSPY